ncbi:MAG: carotenoid 1,2-hydratase [Acidobacteria bacterium]|nr:carotenoid 1,2-hydratase [Acidobacteriota bacterium]
MKTLIPSRDCKGASTQACNRPAGFPLARALAVAALVVLLCCPAGAQQPTAPKEYCTARPGYRYEFPRDHFSHSCFRTEWWYFTGNVATSDGRRFGYQLTFFREAVDNPYPNPSRWRVDDLYLAHFAISDLAGDDFLYTQRISRSGIRLAGADAAAGRLWNGPWSAEVQGSDWTLYAADGENEIRFQMVSRKPPAIQGVNGISQKADGEGNASHYYSLTRLETSGQLRFEGKSYTVSGWSWMDHEFSTSQLQPEQMGWDWISLQMEDGTEWMLFELRRKDGTPDAHSAGSFVDEKGRVVPLAASEFEMTPLEEWTSPASGARFPVRWRVVVPGLGLDVEISAAIPGQQLDTRQTTQIIYWEGSIQAQGTREGKAVEGRGYLEMTGYAGPLPPGLYSSP